MNPEDMEGLNDYRHSQDTPEVEWRSQQQHRLQNLEDMVRGMSQTVERLASLAIPTPTTTPLPPTMPSPTPVPPPQPYLQPPFSFPQPTQSRSAKVSPPEMFSGEKHKIYVFLAKCRHNYLSRPELFTNEVQKVLFASGYFDGAAFNWFQPLLNQYSRAASNNDLESVPAEFQSFENLAKSLEITFGDPDLTRTKEQELWSLTQTTSVSAYLADFNRIRGFLEWNDQSLASAFYRGLKAVVKDGLIYEKPAPKTLAELSAAALRIDSRQYQRLLEARLERRAAPASAPQSHRPSRPPTLAPNPPPPVPPTASLPPFASLPPPRTVPPPTSDGSTPMELDLVQPYPSRPRGPLSDEEKQRRKEQNLCHYCASPSHRIQACPLAPARRPPSQQARTIQVPETPKAPAQE